MAHPPVSYNILSSPFNTEYSSFICHSLKRPPEYTDSTLESCPAVVPQDKQRLSGQTYAPTFPSPRLGICGVVLWVFSCGLWLPKLSPKTEYPNVGNTYLQNYDG